MKLWNKGEPIDKLFERFTIGEDPDLDLYLVKYDIIASIAHVRMLGKIGLLKQEEALQLTTELEKLSKSVEEGNFVIDEGVEDCHSQIEILLTEKLGDLGKKVHAGRSRNDQVLVAIKLFVRSSIKEIAILIQDLFDLFILKAEQNKGEIMPGYTHFQVAMPSSFGLWFSAYAESLIDDSILLNAAFDVADSNPLGSAAGYGSSFPLDREFTKKELKFASLNVSSVYAQMTRGKTEKTVAMAISSIASTLGKFAMDVCMYSGQNFGFFELPKEYTTGSSIMPHKNNPDGFELIRAKCNTLQALPNNINLVLANLPSGYHRDLQVLKSYLVEGVIKIKDCLILCCEMTRNLKVVDNLTQDNQYDLLFTVEEVNRLVMDGLPFRDAYRKVGEMVQKGSYTPDRKIYHTHIGSIGNLGLDQIQSKFEKVISKLVS